ncbi:aspartate-semialdehyde dehydrogenase [Candidatus Magnetominusculus xianensis]|uniref:Aspartate-semialdehyde dehydrogenase n=1 Tax=Candidatus Magnetominusculus xianensis TaxID=1748249 RepID=A0ABR5SER4_9BACT|nr:aspartate-semialdehyde dehydrogenase [Candidatus Magnetominusculus xianensis]KWT85010.1 aspartate-semialdehyde dehydrogenase [Candidatus Magnetominusculus xianensis]MBF0404523.1 aspartate-semialdehyde dehydrogenase [Nitrospirota bacterium]
MLKKKDKYVTAVVGATGAVGGEMISILQERNFPIDKLRLFASERSEGKKLEFRDDEIKVEVLREDVFKGIDIALFSAGAQRSKDFAPFAAKDGCVVIDNSSAWRMDPAIPLVVPEVNPGDLKKHTGIIANPNCSTIQMVVALKPIHDRAKIKRIVVSTYQAVSGTGAKAMDELLEQTKSLLSFQEVKCNVYPHQIAFNCLPQIDVFLDNGYTKEEMKMLNETRKIMGDNSIQVTATTVRVPVFRGHSECVNIEIEKKLTANEVRAILSEAPGVIVFDAPEKGIYPLPLDCAGKDAVYVGRIREDESIPSGLNMWIVSDNLRKGAALNAVQIAEKLIEFAQ